MSSTSEAILQTATHTNFSNPRSPMVNDQPNNGPAQSVKKSLINVPLIAQSVKQSLISVRTEGDQAGLEPGTGLTGSTAQQP